MVIKDKITVGDREIFMSFGLVNELCNIIKDPAQIHIFDLDENVRKAVIESIFAERTKSGRKTNVVELEDLEYSMSEIEKALDWAKEHVMNFFIRRLESTAKLADQTKDKMAKLESSLLGSETSLSTN